ncbi:hypothetical protein B0H19DRAFT_151470 [Mycena capillaripes]|nr:hypothetical protein B0H19DRAFT_151470 [Mycena capillaripes]
MINNYAYESQTYGGLTWDDNQQQWLTMNDGSSMASESPWSVSARALLSQNLCMGGISVSSIDQDNSLGDLTAGIYAPGGLLPTVEAIVASISIDALDSTGYLQDGVYTCLRFAPALGQTAAY